MNIALFNLLILFSHQIDYFIIIFKNLPKKLTLIKKIKKIYKLWTIRAFFILLTILIIL